VPLSLIANSKSLQEVFFEDQDKGAKYRDLDQDFTAEDKDKD